MKTDTFPAFAAAMHALMGLPTDVHLLAAAYPFPLDARVTVEQAAKVIVGDWMADRGYFAP